MNNKPPDSLRRRIERANTIIDKKEADRKSALNSLSVMESRFATAEDRHSSLCKVLRYLVTR